MSISDRNRPPVGVRIAVALSMLPVLLWPWLIVNVSLHDGITRLLLLGAPAYSLLSGYVAYRIYRERKEVAIVLLALVWLSYAAVALLVIAQQS